MIIAVEFKNGRIKEFDTSAFTSGDALTSVDRNAKNLMTEFELRLDKLMEDGLILDVFWYDIAKKARERELEGTADENGNAVSINTAQRRVGYSVTIVNKANLENISRIIVYRANGTVQAAWRQGSENWLIQGSLFEAQRVLTYSDAMTTSLNAQASNVFSYLRRAHPSSSEEEIAAMMGFPLDALEEIMGELGRQDVSFQDSVDEVESELTKRFGEARGAHFKDSAPGDSVEVTPDDTESEVGEAEDEVSGYEMLLSGMSLGPNPMLADFDDEDEEDEDEDE